MPFYFFFGILGLVIGALISWFFLAEHPFESPETPGGPVDAAEASLLAAEMSSAGTPIDETTVTRLLELHGAYVDGHFRAVRDHIEDTQSQVLPASEPPETTPSA
jgi:hypothetical protein